VFLHIQIVTVLYHDCAACLHGLGKDSRISDKIYRKATAGGCYNSWQAATADLGDEE